MACAYALLHCRILQGTDVGRTTAATAAMCPGTTTVVATATGPGTTTATVVIVGLAAGAQAPIRRFVREGAPETARRLRPAAPIAIW